MKVEPAVKYLARGRLIVLIEDIFGDYYQLVSMMATGGILHTDVAISDIASNI